MTAEQDALEGTGELTVAAVRHVILELTADVDDGPALDAETRALVELAVRACGTTLDLQGTELYLRRALDAGVTPEQIQEMLVLVSGIGIHAMLACSRVLMEALSSLSDDRYAGPLSPAQQALREELIGDGTREASTAAVAPGFLENILRLSDPETARAIYAFRAVPWRAGRLTTLQKELVGIAVDTMPSHRFLPTLRLHVANAVTLGAGRSAIAEVLDISAAAPPHRGVW